MTITGINSQAANVPPPDRYSGSAVRRTCQFLCVLVCMVAMSGVLAVTLAQTTLGTIAGNVTDPTGAAIPHCSISIRNLGTGVTRSSSSDSNGFYNVPALQPGQYELTITATGFNTLSRAVTIAPGQTISLDLQLTLAGVTQKVQVTGTPESVLVEKGTHELSQVIETLDLKDLPFASTNYLSLAAQMTPGAELSSSNREGGAASFFGTLGNTIILSGKPVWQTTFLQDGVENVNLLSQTANLILDPAAVQSMSIVSLGANARFDRPSVVNVITKSGTNKFHGQLYDYFRNDAMNAKNYFAQTVPQERFNNFGANLGGPILKGKLFVFFDYNGQRDSAQGVGRARVPTLAERQGDFSADDITIHEPGTLTPYPGNVIPTDQISQFATKYLELYPNPTGPLQNGINYEKNLATTANINQYLGRVDYHLSSSDALWGTIQTGDSPVISEAPVSVFNAVGLHSGWNAYVQEVHSFSPSVVNVARFGFNRGIVFATIEGAGTQDWMQHLGLVNLHPAPSQQAPPQVNISNIGTQGNPFAPDGSTQNRFEYADEVDWNRGNHSMFFGAELDRIQFDAGWVIYNDGSFSYTGQYTGSGLADFMVGLPTSGLAAVGDSVGRFREWDASAYFQDNWKVLPKLTLNLGLRYQFYQPVQDEGPSKASVYHIATNTNVPGSWAPNHLNFAPRIGFAYAAGANTSIRGGYGIYYSPFVYNYVQWLIGKPPNFSLQYQGEGPKSFVQTEDYFSGPPKASALSPFTVNPHMPTPYMQQWNLDVQHAFGSNYLFSVAYVGVVGRHLPTRFNANPATPQDLANPTPVQSRRLYPYVGDVNVVYNLGYSSSNALQTYLKKRFSDGLTFQINYTWSHTLDIQDAGGVYLTNGLDIKADYGSAGYDRTNAFDAYAVYELPFGAGKPFGNNTGWFGKEVIGGWQASGLLSVESGLPFSVIAADTSEIGGTREPYPTRLCKGTRPVGKQTINNWFNTSCFVQPPPGVIGNSGRNILRQPGSTGVTLSALKAFNLGGERSLQFRADAYGAFNHPNFDAAYFMNVNSSTFGKLTSAGGNRTMQLALRFVF